jgi:hypothetical protein
VKDHSKYPAPALALVERDDPSIVSPSPAPRARALGALDHRAAQRSVALALWCAVVDGHGGEVARSWGVSRSEAHRVATGVRPLQLGDVLAAPPDVAAPVLRAALAQVERPAAAHLRASQLVAEAMRAASEALQVAQVLSAAPLGQMPRSVLERAARLVRDVQTRLGLVLVRIEAEIERRPPESSPEGESPASGARRVG